MVSARVLKKTGRREEDWMTLNLKGRDPSREAATACRVVVVIIADGEGARERDSGKSKSHLEVQTSSSSTCSQPLHVPTARRPGMLVISSASQGE
jgi:hypothetical protein